MTAVPVMTNSAQRYDLGLSELSGESVLIKMRPKSVTHVRKNEATER